MMKSSNNPYAAPKVEYEAQPTNSQAYRDGNLVVVGKDTELPRRCWVCNAPAENRSHTKSILWISISAIESNIQLCSYLCDVHERRKRNAKLVLNVVCLVMILSPWLSSVLVQPIVTSRTTLRLIVWRFGFFAAVGIFVAIAARVWGGPSRPFIKRVCDGRLWLKYAGQPFIDSLPDYAIDSRTIGSQRDASEKSR